MLPVVTVRQGSPCSLDLVLVVVVEGYGMLPNELEPDRYKYSSSFFYFGKAGHGNNTENYLGGKKYTRKMGLHNKSTRTAKEKERQKLDQQ